METQNAHVIIPLSVLKEIDRVAGKRMRSRFLTDAAKEHLKRLKLDRALKNAAGAWKDEDHSKLVKSGTAQWVLDQRKKDEQRFSKISRK